VTNINDILLSNKINISHKYIYVVIIFRLCRVLATLTTTQTPQNQPNHKSLPLFLNINQCSMSLTTHIPVRITLPLHWSGLVVKLATLQKAFILNTKFNKLRIYSN